MARALPTASSGTASAAPRRRRLRAADDVAACTRTCCHSRSLRSSQKAAPTVVTFAGVYQPVLGNLTKALRTRSAVEAAADEVLDDTIGVVGGRPRDADLAGADAGDGPVGVAG